MGKNLRAGLFASWMLAFVCAGGPAAAGQLTLGNGSANPITCTVDGYGSQVFTLPALGNVDVPVNAGARAINSVQCGGLATRMMNITQAGPDGTLALNGQQTRVLNVALYSFIPNAPGATFENLVNLVIDAYQQANPQVLLNAQMNPVAQGASPTRIYNFDELSAQLQQGGFDVMEIDTIYIGYLADSGLINPATIDPNGDAPLPVALNAATHNGTLWAIPSWLCMDFLYSRSQGVQGVTNLAQLQAFLAGTPQGTPQLVGDYDGSWRLPSMYINAYAQTYGTGRLNRAFVMPPDPAVIQNMLTVAATCATNNANPCIDGTYHGSATPGVTEQAFATGQAGADMGFSEQSFYINTYAPAAPLYVTPAVWGNQPQPLLFSDAFVTSSANCPNGTPCSADAAAFTTLMSGQAVKAYIVEALDLGSGSPWRTLLVATQPFYARPEIANNPMYQQYTPVFATALAFPNMFTGSLQTQMKTQICQALKAAQPNYSC
jgi:thiamine pyridinylase